MSSQKSLGPLMEVARIQSEINHLFENLTEIGSDREGSGSWVPAVDVLETRDDLIVKIELPGVPLESVTLTCGGGNLIVAGERLQPRAVFEGTTRLAERTFGRFRRAVHLETAVNTRQAEAVLADGVLRVRFPKVPNRRGEQLPIEVKPA